MDLTLVQEFLQYGIFAGLFVALFVWTLKNNKAREDKLTDTLNKFADSVGGKLDGICTDLEEVKADVDEIKDKMQ